jgi:hypothetical protein
VVVALTLTLTLVPAQPAAAAVSARWVTNPRAGSELTIRGTSTSTYTFTKAYTFYTTERRAGYCKKPYGAVRIRLSWKLRASASAVRIIEAKAVVTSVGRRHHFTGGTLWSDQNVRASKKFNLWIPKGSSRTLTLRPTGLFHPRNSRVMMGMEFRAARGATEPVLCGGLAEWSLNTLKR